MLKFATVVCLVVATYVKVFSEESVSGL